MSASAPSNGEDSTLAIKCMDFCHALASQGMAFSFSLSVGSDFSFSLDAREKKKAASVSTEEVRKKKLSPSKVRRNAKRRQEFLKRKSETSDKGNLGSPAAVGGIPCAPALHHLLSPSPTSGRRRVMSVGRPEMPNFSSLNLDGSCSPTPPPPPTSPPPVAPLPCSPTPTSPATPSEGDPAGPSEAWRLQHRQKLIEARARERARANKTNL